MWWAGRILIGVLQPVPVEALSRLGAAGGRGFGRLHRPLHQAVCRQLERRLGVEPGVARALADAQFEHLGRTVAECSRLPELAAQGDARVELRPQDAARLRGLRDRHGGLIVAAGHLGNWELMAARLAQELQPAVVFARGPADPRWAAWWRGVRRRVGIETFDRGLPPWRWRRLRRQRPAVGFLVDQATDVEGEPVPFFGAPAFTPNAPVRLARRTGWPVVVATAERRADGRHRVHVDFLEPLPRDHLLATISVRLEDRIRARPDQWPWVHDRWRAPVDPAPRGDSPGGP